MDRKAKGTNAERELIHLLWRRGWFAVRVAGSGSTKYPSPDIIAGNGLRRIAVECKSSADDRRYITKRQVSELALFARMLNAEPWLGFRHDAEWYFVALDDLRDTGKSLLVSEDLVRNRGLGINELAGPEMDGALAPS